MRQPHPDETPLAPAATRWNGPSNLPRPRPDVSLTSRGVALERTLKRLASGVCLLLLCLAAPARAAWMVPASPYRAKDFTIVKRDGWFHCFYILKDVTVPYDSTER